MKEVEKSFQKLSTDPTSAAELVEQHPAVFTGSEVGARHHLLHMCYFDSKGLVPFPVCHQSDADFG